MSSAIRMISSALAALSDAWRSVCIRIALRTQATVAEARGRYAALKVRNEAGQTVAEYALVLLVAAAIAAGFLLWAKQSGRLDTFFDAIFERLLGSVEGE